MKIRTKPFGMLIILLLIIIAAGCLNVPSTKPAWTHDVNWQGDKPGSTAAIETQLWTQISPYNTAYEFVNITAKSESSGLHLRIVAISNAAEYPDIYDFTYSEGTLTRTGYLLEVIPLQDRESAIVAAMQNKDVRDAGASGIPTVRRILPDTSEKYYAPRTLLSVTWTGVSALVDPQVGKVVKVWKENSGVE